MTVENEYRAIVACCTSQNCDRRLQCRRVGVSELVRQDISAHYMCKSYSLYIGEEIKAEVIEVLEDGET